jgi:spermidine synthase/Na+-transporting methylmalonyl-CoA/oxaloacetate decarboxylase gamma subunit
MAPKPLYLEIFLTSLGALLLEIAYTRIFSFKVLYYFTYLLLGMGLLGIGAGGIVVAISDRVRKIGAERLVPAASFAGGAAVLVGYLVIAPLQLNIAQAVTSPTEITKLVGVCLLLTAAFFAVGLVISTILSTNPDLANRLYAADLLGAALGCSIAVPLTSALTPPRTVMLSGMLLAAAGLRLARGSSMLLGLGAAILVATAVPIVVPSVLEDPTVAQAKLFEDVRALKLVRQTVWSPVFRVDVASYVLDPENVFIVFHDGQPGSGIRRFDGTFDRFAYLDKDSRALPFSVIPKDPRVLVIGAAGGHEVVASLYFEAGHVTGVELNPAMYDIVTTVMADVTGHLAEHPKVTYLNGDGRWFMKQSREKFDLIWFVAPDSYAAMNVATSGAFVLSESYLYTTEMVKESLARLTDDGVICMVFGEFDFDWKPNRTARYLSTARAAFRELGMPRFDEHVMLASAPGYPPFREFVTILSRKAITPEQIAAFRSRTASVTDGIVLFAPGDRIVQRPESLAIGLPESELPRFFSTAKYLVDPVRDDAPFFWHFTRFRDAIMSPLPEERSIENPEDTIAEQLMLAFLGIAVVLAAAFLVLPLIVIREAWGEMPQKGLALTYFAALGLGFMFVEVAMIQKLTLLLGYPTYSLSVTLFALLVFSGLGSLASERLTLSRNRTLGTAFGVLAAWVLLAQAGLPAIIDSAVGGTRALRIAVTIALVAPMGLCLGSFMPLGLRTISRITTRPREYVAWACAVNGFFSVIASILATILGMVVGFRWLLVIALAVYAVGIFAFSRLPEGSAKDPS